MKVQRDQRWHCMWRIHDPSGQGQKGVVTAKVVTLPWGRVLGFCSRGPAHTQVMLRKGTEGLPGAGRWEKGSRQR